MTPASDCRYIPTLPHNFPLAATSISDRQPNDVLYLHLRESFIMIQVEDMVKGNFCL